jgi:general stress protein YciG
MDWKKLADRAKQMINQRGGTESVKEDAQELRNIARQEGPAEDKIKAAAEALRDPGAPGGQSPPQPPAPAEPSPPQPPTPAKPSPPEPPAPAEPSPPQPAASEAPQPPPENPQT